VLGAKERRKGEKKRNIEERKEWNQEDLGFGPFHRPGRAEPVKASFALGRNVRRAPVGTEEVIVAESKRRKQAAHLAR
jgi:hypothetical protein